MNAYETYTKDHGKPDLVHLNVCYPLGVWALYLKKKAGIPFIVTEHSSGLHLGTDHSYPAHILALSKRVMSGAEKILPVSTDLRRSLEKMVPTGSFEVISNVVDEEIFLSVEKDKSDIKRFIHISTGVDPIKNLSGMIRAFDTISQKRQDWSLDIVSDGDVEYAKLLAAGIHHPSLIRFHSTQTTEQIAELLQQSDVLVLFSNYENFPCVITEAFMTGKPVISTAVNGIPEHVNTQNGILIERGNESQLADSIEKILNNEVTFDTTTIRQYALGHFSYKMIGKKLDAIYRQVLSRARNTHDH